MLSCDKSPCKGHKCHHEACSPISGSSDHKSYSTFCLDVSECPDSSADDEKPADMALDASVPSWVPAMIGTTFFNPCPNGHEGYRKDECTFFCTTCAASGVRGLCQHCVESHQQEGHHTIQIRRYVYCDVVRATDISPHMDISGVQVYIVNQAKVVFLNHRPQSKPSRLCTTDACRTCFRQLREGCSFCSLSCKVQAVNSGNVGPTATAVVPPKQPAHTGGAAGGHKRSACDVEPFRADQERKKVKMDPAEALWMDAAALHAMSTGAGRTSSASSVDEGMSMTWVTPASSSGAQTPKSVVRRPSSRDLKAIRAMALPMKRGSSVSSLDSLQMRMSLPSLSSGRSSAFHDARSAHQRPSPKMPEVLSSSDSEELAALAEPVATALAQMNQAVPLCAIHTHTPLSPLSYSAPDTPGSASRRKQGCPLRSPVF